MASIVTIKVKSTTFGSLRAYEGTVIKEHFSDSEFGTAEFDAKEWLIGRLLKGDAVLSSDSTIDQAALDHHQEQVALSAARTQVREQERERKVIARNLKSDDSPSP
jgi:hypothetical protein